MKRLSLLLAAFVVVIGCAALFALALANRYVYMKQDLPGGRSEVVRVDRFTGNTTVLRTYNNGQTVWTETTPVPSPSQVRCADLVPPGTSNDPLLDKVFMDIYTEKLKTCRH